MSNNFEVIVRAVAIRDGKILLCRGKDKEYFYFPGGHLEWKEKAEEALKRELKEELGAESEIGKFIGMNENVYTDENKTEHHEINLVFEARIGDSAVRSLEDWLEFSWETVENFGNLPILPSQLKQIVGQWLRDALETKER